MERVERKHGGPFQWSGESQRAMVAAKLANMVQGRPEKSPIGNLPSVGDQLLVSVSVGLTAIIGGLETDAGVAADAPCSGSADKAFFL
jgi:hypothetical protein